MGCNESSRCETGEQGRLFNSSQIAGESVYSSVPVRDFYFFGWGSAAVLIEVVNGSVHEEVI